MPKRKQDTRRSLSRNQAAVEMSKIGAIARVIVDLGRVAGVVACFWAVAYMVNCLAGKTTFADIGLNFLGRLGISRGLAWLLAAGGTTFGLQQRSLRLKEIRRHGPRIAELEAAIDTRRSSSNLDDSGHSPDDD